MTPNWQKIPCAVFNRLYIQTKRIISVTPLT